MSWLFSQALVEEYSAATCSDGEPYAQLNVMPTPHKFWHRDKMMDASDLSRFGLTLRLLTDDHGAALLMWFREGSLARTLAQQEKAQDYPAKDRDSGRTWHGSFAKWSQKECLWKTVQCSLLEDSESYSGIWPRWGSMRNGVSYLRPTLALRTSESGSGLWQTIVADDAIERKVGKFNSRGEAKFSAQIRMPTLTVCGNYNRKGASATSGDGLATVLGGNPNPMWCEWFMGFPMRWTELDASATAKFLEWQQQHGGFLANETK